MKLGIYTIINDPLPKLYELKQIVVNKKDFEYEEDIVKILRHQLNIDKMDSEFVFALSLTYGLIPRGIILNGIGNNQQCSNNLRGMAIGLLLTGAEQFYVFHNHPGKSKDPSISDRKMSDRYEELGGLLHIDFIKHIMIAGDYYTECRRWSE